MQKITGIFNELLVMKHWTSSLLTMTRGLDASRTVRHWGDWVVELWGGRGVVAGSRGTGAGR